MSHHCLVVRGTLLLLGIDNLRRVASELVFFFFPLLVSLRAAYNGFTETVRLLLFRDACQNRQDNTGKSLSLRCI